MKCCLLNRNPALITAMNTELDLVRLMQLVSPGLPIGMYSYSQGFEMAVEDGWLCDGDAAAQWIGGLMEHCLSCLDIPVAARLFDAWALNDLETVHYWSQLLIASRETHELRMEDLQTGQSLARLLRDMEVEQAAQWIKHPSASLATLYSLAAIHWQIDKQNALSGYLWSWLENQVLCAVKLVPLGQVAGQRLLFRLAGQIPALLNQALALTDDEIGGSVFGLALASSRHEVQYSRLFRS